MFSKYCAKVLLFDGRKLNFFISIIMKKNHEAPEFQVIRQNEANAKFFVASFDGDPVQGTVGSTPGSVANAYSKANANGWF